MGAQGTADLDFGAFPGKSDASVAVTGQAGIVAGSLAEAWVRPEVTADHTADEHMVETIKVIAGNIVAGTGFTIYGFNVNQVHEPADHQTERGFAASAVGQPGSVRSQARASEGGKGTRLYGVWKVAWVWN